MRSPFHTPEGIRIVVELVAVVHKFLAHPPAGLVVVEPIYAMVVDLFPWSDAVDIANERTVLNAKVRLHSIASKTIIGIVDDGCIDFSGVSLLVPITME